MYSTVAAVRRAAARPSASARFSVAARLTTNSEYSTCFLLYIIGITHCHCGIVCTVQKHLSVVGGCNVLLQVPTKYVTRQYIVYCTYSLLYYKAVLKAV